MALPGAPPARRAALLAAALLMAAGAPAQLPPDHDSALVAKTCTRCHEVDRVLSQRQDHDGWQTTVSKMQSLGLQADAADLRRIVNYLATHFPAETGPRLNINQASAVELEAAFSLPRRTAAATVRFREQIGGFKSLDDLKKVPGFPADKVDNRKSRLTI